MNTKDRWSALSLKDRADLIKLYTDNGITDIKVMKKDYNGIPYKDFNTSEYDYFNAHPSNAPTKEGEHWTSRNPKTGQLLKREDHPTFDLMIEGEKQAGYNIIKGLDGNLYSIPNTPNNYVEDYNTFAIGGPTTWEKVDEVVDTAEPWVSGTSLALLGATAVQPELGVVTIPAMAVANGAGVLFDGYQAVRDFQNGNYRSGAWNSIEAITGAFGAKAASKLARTAGGRAIGKFKEQLVEDRFRSSGDKVTRLMRKGLTYEKAAERVLQNAVNYVDNSSKVKDVSNGIREAYNKRFDTGATVLDAVFDTTDVGEGIFSRFKDEHPIEIYKFGGVLNTFDDGGATNTISKKSFIRDFISNFKGFDPTSLISTFVPILSSNQKEEVILNEELAKELNIDPDLTTFVVPDELSERTFVSKVNDRIKEKTNNELRDEIKSKSKDEIIEIQGQLANEGYYDFQLKEGKIKEARNIQKRLVKEGLLQKKDVDGNIGEKTITALQTLLVSKGYLPEVTESGKTNIDGLLGKRTREAFKLYNRDYNVDGDAGNRTIDAYLKREKSKNQGFNAKVSAEGMADQCAKWVTKKYDTVAGNSQQNGVIGNAWEMIKNVEDKGGKSLFNIYEDPLFDNVKSPQQIKQAVDTYLSRNKIDYSSLQPGDIVGIHNPSSNHYTDVLETGTTYNTHVGIVVDIQNGVPIIEHNILEGVRRESIDKLTGSKYGRPVVTAASRPVQGERVKGNLEFENVMSDISLPSTPNSEMQEYMNSLASSKKVFKEIYPEVDMDFIEKAAIAIVKRETNFMEDKSSDVKRGSAGAKSMLSARAREMVHMIKGTPEESKSRDLTKMKFKSLSSNYRDAIGLYNPEQLDNDPIVTGRATMLLLSKNYDYFKRYAEENPKLGLTEEDIRNATILSYNRGLGSVSSLGFDTIVDKNTGEAQYLPDFAEIKYLREKSKPGAKEKDFTSTSLNYLSKISGLAGALAELYYNKYGSPHTTYIASANKVIEELEKK